MHELVLANGRVIDPETGFDRVCDVGIDGASITAVADRLDGATTVDVGGLVVAPGFVDLHSHAQTLPGRRLQACDGVTPACVDLEAGRAPVEIAYAKEAKRGSPINYGFSASWAAARMHVVADAPLDGTASAIFGGLAGREVATSCDLGTSDANPRPALHRPCSRRRRCRRAHRLYTRGSAGRVSRRRGTWRPPSGCRRSRTRATLSSWIRRRRSTARKKSSGPRAATGAHMHYCHINSTSGRHIDRVLALVGRCQSEGARVTTEAYPYGSGSTAIGRVVPRAGAAG